MYVLGKPLYKPFWNKVDINIFKYILLCDCPRFQPMELGAGRPGKGSVAGGGTVGMRAPPVQDTHRWSQRCPAGGTSHFSPPLATGQDVGCTWVDPIHPCRQANNTDKADGPEWEHKKISQ